MKRRAILISNSTYPIADTGGGSIILYRHLKRLEKDGFEIVIVNLIANSNFNSPFKEINITRRWYFPPLRRYFGFVKLRCWFLGIIIAKQIEFKEGDIVISVLGEYINLSSYYLAEKKKLRHYLFFHDDNIFNKYGEGNLLKPETYIKIAKTVGHIYAVSPELKKLLTDYGVKEKKISVLYPIPEGCINRGGHSIPKFNRNFSGFYSGAIFFEYHQEILAKIILAFKTAKCNLNIFTHSKLILPSEIINCSGVQLNPPFKTLYELKQFLVKDTWVNLIFYSFDPEKELRIVSSFPSKFVEFVHTGIPTLIIAPDFSSIGKWAVKQGWLAYCPTDSVDDIVVLLNKFKDIDFWKNCQNQSIKVAETIFDPEFIHQSFLKEIRSK